MCELKLRQMYRKLLWMYLKVRFTFFIKNILLFIGIRASKKKKQGSSEKARNMHPTLGSAISTIGQTQLQHLEARNQESLEEKKNSAEAKKKSFWDDILLREKKKRSNYYEFVITFFAAF